MQFQVWTLLGGLLLASAVLADSRHIIVAGCRDGAYAITQWPKLGLEKSLKVSTANQSTIATTEEKGNVIHIWSHRSGKQVEVLEGHKEPITQLALHPRGNILVSIDESGEARLWWHRGDRFHAESAIINLEVEKFSLALFSVDGGKLFLTSEGKVISYAVETLISNQRHETGVSMDLPGMKNGPMVLFEETVQLHLAKGNETTVGSPLNPVQRLAVDKSGNFAAASTATDVLVWSTKNPHDKKPWTKRLELASESEPSQISLSATGELLGVGMKDGTVQVWDTFTQREIFTVQASEAPIIGVYAVDDPRLIQVMTTDMKMRLYSIDSGALLLETEFSTKVLEEPLLGARPGLL